MYCTLILLNCNTHLDGKSYYYYFPSQTCNSGIGILHTALAYIMIFVLLTLGFIITYLYFEPRYNSKKVWEKINGFPEVILLFYKFIMAFSMNFLRFNYDVLLLALLSMGAFILILYLNFYPHLHNPYTYKLRLLQLGILNWTSMYMIFAKCSHHTIFENVFQVWLIGVVCIVFIVIMR